MNFIENESLSAHSNFKIGGPARFLFSAKNEEEILAALSMAKDMGLPCFVLAGGTNILFSDDGFPGLVLKPSIEFMESDGDKISAGSGTPMSKLLNFSAYNNLAGLEWAGGLPGTLGGAIRGNAGCFGAEIKDCVESVKSLDIESGKTILRTNAECEFAYRNSIFKKDRKEIILSAVLLMMPGERERILSAAQEKIDYRKARQPLGYPNVGSIFKNVSVENFKSGLTDELKTHIKNDPLPLIPAAVLISQAGLKGKKIGDAQISEKHANFIINLGAARAADVLGLIETVKMEVLNKFGVVLVTEIEIVGF